jgi:peptidoglycan/LPS O-acetylase OafA/YrhL
MSLATHQQNLAQCARVDPNAGLRLVLPRNPRYLSLDLWRGVACLMVVVGHSAVCLPNDSTSAARRIILVLGAGWLAVLGFFVISGYCIAATCDSMRRRPHGLGNYFRRRFRRIFPPYWVALFATAAFVAAIGFVFGPQLLNDDPAVLPNPRSLSAIQWLGNILLIENWRSNAFGGTRLLQLGPAWTLCYEEQFYALCGLVLLLGRRRFFWGIVGVSILTLAIMAAHRSIPGLFFDGNWFLFAAGVLVYFHVNYASRLQQWLLTVALVATAGLVVARYPLSDWRSPIFFFGPVIALLFLVLHPFDLKTASACLLQPLKFCGAICYSLYLVHWPIVKLLSHSLYLAGLQSDWGTLLVTIPLCVTASLLVAWGFHVAVERRFLNSPNLAEKQVSNDRRLGIAGQAIEDAIPGTENQVIG